MGGVGSSFAFMVRRVSLMLAIALACSTVLAGVPLSPAAADLQVGPVIAPLPFEPEGVSASRGEEIAEEREEEKAAASTLDLFTRPRVAVVLDMHRTGRTALDTPRAAPGDCDSVCFIRGPPAG